MSLKDEMPEDHRIAKQIRFTPPGERGLASRAAAARARLRWYQLILKYPSLRRQPPMRLGAGSQISLRGQGSLSVGRNVTASRDITISAYGPVRLGEGVFLGRGVNIACYGAIDIGDGTRLAERVSIHDSDHVMEPLADRDARASESIVMPVTIGHRVWLAANVVVAKGVTLGDDVVVGANSVVTRDLPSGTLAAGAPARVVRSLAE